MVRRARPGRGRRRGWRRRAKRALFWSLLIGVPLAILAFLVLCVAGLFVLHGNAATAHPVLARFALAGMVLVIGTLCAVFTAGLLRAYVRMWRLRLRGVTEWATVERVYTETGASSEDGETRHAIVRVDGVVRPIEVGIWSGRPQVGERIRVRYLSTDPTEAVQVRRTIGSALLTLIADGVILYLLAGGLTVLVGLLGLLLFGKLG